MMQTDDGVADDSAELKFYTPAQVAEMEREAASRPEGRRGGIHVVYVRDDAGNTYFRQVFD